MTCVDRQHHIVIPPCLAQCQPRCVCPPGYVRRVQQNDLCVEHC